MVKQFRFDDEDNEDILEDDYKQPSHIDELETMKEKDDETFDFMQDQFDSNYYDDEDEENEGEQDVSKKKKNFVWKWWHYVLIGVGVFLLAFVVYIVSVTSSNGPVYGNRCEGLVSISNDLITATENEIKETYSEVTSIDLEIACRQLKVDIAYKEGTSTKTAKKIAEKAVQTLDDMVGQTKDEGKTYSRLFGTIDNVSQYEVNLYLTCEDNDDLPAYGTKNVQNDKFSYTYASIRDKDSYNKARETLEEDK